MPSGLIGYRKAAANVQAYRAAPDHPPAHPLLRLQITTERLPRPRARPAWSTQSDPAVTAHRSASLQPYSACQLHPPSRSSGGPPPRSSLAVRVLCLWGRGWRCARSSHRRADQSRRLHDLHADTGGAAIGHRKRTKWSGRGGSKRCWLQPPSVALCARAAASPDCPRRLSLCGSAGADRQILGRRPGAPGRRRLGPRRGW